METYRIYAGLNTQQLIAPVSQDMLHTIHIAFLPLISFNHHNTITSGATPYFKLHNFFPEEEQNNYKVKHAYSNSKSKKMLPVRQQRTVNIRSFCFGNGI